MPHLSMARNLAACLLLAASALPASSQVPPFGDTGALQTASDDSPGLELPDIGPDGLQPHPGWAPATEEDFVVVAGELDEVPEGRLPLVRQADCVFHPSDAFVAMAPTLAIMNSLSYKRGCDLRHGHELVYGETLKGWELTGFKAVRGFTFGDPNAGFVAHHRGLRSVCILLHGSINNADWLTNVASHPVPIKDYCLSGGTPLDLAGCAHQGFLAKYLSCKDQIMSLVDGVLATLSEAEKEDTRFYVSGHSQAAAMGQLLVGHLCQHLCGAYGVDFNNTRENRVHAWLLSSPLALDAAAVQAVEALVGRNNIVVQNTWLDPVPAINLSTQGCAFHSLGTPLMQDALEAMRRADRAHQEAIRTHLVQGDLLPAAWGTVMDPYSMAKMATAATHMATDNVNYRGIGSNYAFDPDMVLTSREGLKAGLEAAFLHSQGPDSRLGTSVEGLRRWALSPF